MENTQTRSRRRGYWILVIIVSIIFGGIAGILADKLLFPYLSTIPWLSRYEIFKSKGKEITIERTIEKTVSVKEEEAILEAAKKVMPSLVTIQKVQTCPPKTLCKPEVKASGFILSSDGLITSSKANLSKKEKYQIVDSGGKSYPVEEIIFDPLSSLAFLKIKAENLPVVELGWPEDIRLGRKIIALSKNQNLENVLEAGIIKDVDFSILDSYTSHGEELEKAFILDKDLDKDFSGGPAISLEGKVIGLNIVSKEQSYILPPDIIRSAFESQAELGKISRAFLGILYIDLRPRFSQLNNLSKDYGALIVSSDPKVKPVITNSPAEKAGLESQDIILALDENKIDQEKSLGQILRQYKAGDEVELTVLREGQELKIKVRLSEMK